DLDPVGVEPPGARRPFAQIGAPQAGSQRGLVRRLQADFYESDIRAVESGDHLFGQMLTAQLGIERHPPIGVQVLKGAHQRPEQRYQVEIGLNEMYPLDAALASPANLCKHAL